MADKDNAKKSFPKEIVIGVILLAIVLFMAYTMTQNKQDSTSTTQESSLAGAAIGGDFTLIDHNGNTVTQSDYKGSYKLVFFGFTFCPHICPTELQKLTLALKTLGDDANKITPLFISTDPERDTQEVMKEYVQQFDPRIIGLTGTVEQSKHAQDLYKVYAAKVNDPELSDYTMNHSAYTYLMGPNDEPLAIFKMDDSAQDIADGVRKFLN